MRAYRMLTMCIPWQIQYNIPSVLNVKQAATDQKDQEPWVKSESTGNRCSLVR